MKKLGLLISCGLLCLLQPATEQMQAKARPFAKLNCSLPLRLLQIVDHGGTIESKYDGFNHETVVRLKKMRIGCSAAKGLQSTVKDTCISVAASLHAPGIQLDYVRYATLQLIFETKDWDRRHALDQ